MLGIPIAILKDSSGAAVGDAYLAGLGTGQIGDIREIIKANIEIDNRYSPDAKKNSYYQERYQRFRGLYESLKPEFDN